MGIPLKLPLSFSVVQNKVLVSHKIIAFLRPKMDGMK